MEQNTTEDIETVRGADLAHAQKAKAPKKTWFFERGDGMIFPAEEVEAWNILNNKSEWMRHDFKMVGCSDGTTYARIIRESLAESEALKPEIRTLEAEVDRYVRAEENLIMNEAVDMEDETDPVNKVNIDKVLRLRGIKDRALLKLEKLREDFRKATGDVVSRAMSAEMEAGRGHYERPGRMDIITPDSSPEGRTQLVNMVGTRKS